MKAKQNDLFSVNVFGDTAPFVPGSHTSRESAKAIESRLNALQQKVLALLRKHEGGLTDEQGMWLSQISASTYRPRRIELVKLGLVKDSGRMAETRSGRWAVLWIAMKESS